MDFHELVLAGDLFSIGVQIDEVGRMYAYLNYQHSVRNTQQVLIPVYRMGGVSCCLELSVGEEDLLTLEVPLVKNSSYKGPNRRSNSCCDGAVVSADGETSDLPCSTQYFEANNQGLRNFNEAANAWKEKPNFNWAHAQTFTSPQNGSFSTYSSSYQMKLKKELTDFDSHQEKRLSSLRTQLEQKHNNMISKINILWKSISEKLDDAPIRDTTGNPAAQMNFTSTKDPTREELRGKGIKSRSKLLSLKYLSQSSLAEQNRNPSSPKCVHFVNSIVILNKENEAKEERNVKISTTEYEDHEMTVESEEEFEEETKDEIEEEEEDSPKHFDTFPTMKELRYYEWL
ncbi:hypothetical protein Tco_0938788 [Tanacetum coccineum]|uniref:Uncharacterized protein n=1 Tax=Tanacetum coccineum TaxID=301880 RepID=A0ABQ5DKW5_9ASTR